MEDRGPLKDPVDMDMGVFFNIRYAYRKGLSIAEIAKIHWYSEDVISECCEDIDESQ